MSKSQKSRQEREGELWGMMLSGSGRVEVLALAQKARGASPGMCLEPGTLASELIQEILRSEYADA